MRAILDYCSGGVQRNVPAGASIIREGGTSGHLYVLIEGRLEVAKGDTVVAVISEPGAVLGEMSVLLDQPHSATVRAASDSTVYEFGSAAAFLRDQPAVALLIARMLAQRARLFKHDVEMEPKSAYERLVIHELFSNDPEIKTESAGEGKFRHIVLKYKDAALAQ